MAGLPKAFFVLSIVLGTVAAVACVGFADGLQTDSVTLPPNDVQTSSNVLQPVLDRIESNLVADPTDVAALKILFESAVTSELLTVEQSLAMLELVEWTALADAETLANASAILETILSDLLSGVLIDDPVLALTRLLNVLATPSGTLTAIGKAGAPQEILDQVSSLAASGVPPGILVRITKEGLRTGLSMEEIAAQLDLLAETMSEGEDVAWGQIANEVTNQGENKHQDQEQNANIAGNEEPEEEANQHGNSQASKDSNPGKGQGKTK
jgi:hypothetical protein